MKNWPISMMPYLKLAKPLNLSERRSNLKRPRNLLQRHLNRHRPKPANPIPLPMLLIQEPKTEPKGKSATYHATYDVAKHRNGPFTTCPDAGGYLSNSWSRWLPMPINVNLRTYQAAMHRRSSDNCSKQPNLSESRR